MSDRSKKLGVEIRALLGICIQINQHVDSLEVDFLTPRSVSEKIDDNSILDHIAEKLRGKIDLHWLNNEEVYPGFTEHLKWALNSYQNCYGEPDNFKLGLTYFMSCLLGVLQAYDNEKEDR